MLAGTEVKYKAEVEILGIWYSIKLNTSYKTPNTNYHLNLNLSLSLQIHTGAKSALCIHSSNGGHIDNLPYGTFHLKDMNRFSNT